MYGSGLKMKVFKCELKGVQAWGICGSGKLFIIQKGSGAVGDDKLEKCFLPARKKERERLISNGTLTKNGDDYLFQKDHTFKVISKNILTQ